MAASNFINCLNLTLYFEGGYAHNPFDPGGATYRGITLNTLRAFRSRPVARAELLTLSQKEIENIYKIMFWDVIKADEMAVGVDAVLFDYAVNSGPRLAIKAAQNILKLSPTGKCDEYLLQILHQTSPVQMIAALSQQRRSFMARLKQFSLFKKGWITRVNHVETAAKTMCQSNQH